MPLPSPPPVRGPVRAALYRVPSPGLLHVYDVGLSPERAVGARSVSGGGDEGGRDAAQGWLLLAPVDASAHQVCGGEGGRKLGHEQNGIVPSVCVMVGDFISLMHERKGTEGWF